MIFQVGAASAMCFKQHTPKFKTTTLKIVTNPAFLKCLGNHLSKIYPLNSLKTQCRKGQTGMC